jgi:acetyl esterase/lipase
MTDVALLKFDPELDAVLATLKDVLPPTITAEMIPLLGQAMPGVPTPEEILGEAGLERRDFTIAGFNGDEIEVSVIRRPGHAGVGPGIFHTHGGGMIAGDRWTGIREIASWVNAFDAVGVTVEYRLAPAFPDPYPVEDCYAGLVWTAEHADELGIDLDRLLIAGSSAGGGLAAGTALLARDRRGPGLAGQMLIYAMLDDRDSTVSTSQVDGIGVWDRTSNITGWTALLGDRRGTEDVSIYAAPARATDLSGLPASFVDCASVEVFRDEDVAYATKLWASGVQTELHVWPGGFHGFEQIAPHVPIAKDMVERRMAWVERLFAN